MQNNEITKNDKQIQQSEFAEIAKQIKQTHVQVFRIANASLIELYWKIGSYISNKVHNTQWGKSVVKELALYINKEIPDVKGFSDKNLWRMKQFYETYKKVDEKLSTLLREISWSNNLLIISRTKTIEERIFYLELCKNEHLSYRELDRQITTLTFERSLQKPKISNFLKEIAPNAKNVFKDTYVMEFLSGKEYKNELELKSALINNMKDFILELGKDFIFIDQEYRLQVGNSDFRIDLLFYHRELQCLVAFELKMEQFKPEHLGQLNFYLEALDRDVKKAKENPSIGVLLCTDKDTEVVEYALSRSLSPTLIAEYKLHLPDKKLFENKLKELIEKTEF